MIKGYFITKEKDVYTLDTADVTFMSPTWVYHSDNDYNEDEEVDFSDTYGEDWEPYDYSDDDDDSDWEDDYDFPWDNDGESFEDWLETILD